MMHFWTQNRLTRGDPEGSGNLLDVEASLDAFQALLDKMETTQAGVLYFFCKQGKNRSPAACIGAMGGLLGLLALFPTQTAA